MIEIVNFIQFGGFNSKALGLYLIEADYPSPEEKEAIVNNPNRDGETDYAAIRGEKKFESRIITYQFRAFRKRYRDRNSLQIAVKSKTVTQLPTSLYDTYYPYHHWVGKCISVTAEDDQDYNFLTVTLEFKCYPYMYSNSLYYDDLVFNKTADSILAWTKWAVEGSKDITVYNPGERKIDVDIIVDSNSPIIESETENSSEQVEIVTVPAKTYKVLKGDTLWRIATNNGVTVNDLKKWNNITGDWVYPGDTLIVKPAETTTRVVESGGTTNVTRTYYMKLIDESGKVHYLNNGMNYAQDLMLFVGANGFKVEGKGTIAFHYRAEVMA